MNQLIDPKMAAQVLRKLAEEFENGKYHIQSMEHDEWDTLNKYQIHIKWSKVK